MKKRLDAVNILLQTIGEQPLTTDEELAASFEGTTAVAVLEEVKLDVLSEGFYCNTDEDWTFSPDQNGYIPVPANVIAIDPSDPYLDISILDHKLFDKKNKTWKFKTKVLCHVTWDLDFDDIPHPIQYYITIKAARRFQGRVIGDQVQYAFTKEDEEEAKIQLRRYEADTGDYNVFDNYSVSRVINRSFNPMSGR